MLNSIMLRHFCVKFGPVIVLVLLFAASVLLRAPNFNVDPGTRYGWTQFQRYNNAEVWGHDEFVLAVYRGYPASVHKFASYIGGGDEFIKNDSNPSLTVYTSFPPAVFIALYSALKPFGIFTYQAMEVFSLVLQAICVGLMAYLAYILTRNKLMSVLAGSMYIFSTGTLWYHMNVYWSHQLLVPVFLTALIIFVKRKGRMRWWEGLLLGMAMSWVTWTGAVAAVGFGVHGAYKYYKTKNKAYLNSLLMLVGLVVALLAILAQVMFATGASPFEYLGKVLHRASARSAVTTSMAPPVMIWRFMNDLLLDYGGFAIIAFALAMRRTLASFEKEVMFVASFPLVESFVVLEHDTVYGFGRLKWLVPIILLICILGAKLDRRRRLWLSVAVAAACIIHLGLYYVVY